MAKVGNLYLGGKEISGNSYFQSGVSFSLNQAPTFNYLLKSDDNNWEVELKANEDSIVARSKQPSDVVNLIPLGFEQIQKSLDIIAVKKLGIFLLSNPESSYIALYNKENRSILRYYSVIDFPISISSSVEIRDRDGNIKPQPKPTEPVWTWAFRYYRLSQASQDIFEAYRNLFLSFEALLNHICPKNRNEREGTWLKRALTQISNEISFNEIMPNAGNLVEYIFQHQYKKTRCKLLHAKHPDAYLPHSQLNPTDVLAAYEELIRLWNHIAARKFFVQSGGGVVTYTGFRLWMDSVFSRDVKFYFTEDSSAPKSEDTEVSPLNKRVFQFEKNEYLGESRPGFVALKGKIDITPQFNEMPIFRIGLINENILYNISYFSLPLAVIGADEFETIQEIRLINAGQPKTIFKNNRSYSRDT